MDEYDPEYDEPLDLGEPHKMSEEEFEDFKKSLNDESDDEYNEPIVEDINDEEDDEYNEPIVDDINDEEDDEYNEPIVEDINDEEDKEYDEPIADEKEEYANFEETDKYKEIATDPNSSGEDLHNAFIDHLKKYNK